MVITLCYKDS